jgi:molybdopterin-containing oxidoreductase family membrane subunit
VKHLRLKLLFWVVGVLLLAAGIPGWYDRLTHGHLNANYGSLVPWGLWVAAYIYFVGLSAGSFLISSLVYVFNLKQFEKVGRLALFTALVTLLLALLSIWADLGHMERFWHVFAYPNFRSPMAWMIWLYTTYFVLLAVELWFLLRRDLVRGAQNTDWKARVYRVLSLGSKDQSETSAQRDRKIVKVLASIGIPIAIMFHGGVGTLFGIVAARPAWHSGLFPVLFLLSALASGAALLTVTAAIFQDGWTSNRETVLALGRLVLALLLLDVLFQFSEILIAYAGGVPGHTDSLNLILTGPYAWVFWGLQVLVGTLIPILLLAGPTRTDPRLVSLAGLMIVLGFIGVRLNIVIPGLATEEIRGMTEAVSSPRINTAYFPSTSEWLLTAGIVGLGLVLFGIGELLLPRDEKGVGHVPA